MRASWLETRRIATTGAESPLENSRQSFAHLLFNFICKNFVFTQYPGQGAFVLKRSMIDRIIGLWFLIEQRLECWCGFLAAYVHFKKVFNFVDRRTFFTDVGLLQGFVLWFRPSTTYMKSAIMSGSDESRFFPVRSGERQGCILALIIFLPLYQSLLNNRAPSLNLWRHISRRKAVLCIIFIYKFMNISFKKTYKLFFLLIE